MRKLSISEDQDVAGFVLNNAREGEEVAVQVRGVALSDEPLFYTYLKHISALYFHPNLIQPESLTHFVIVIHANRTATIYLNDEIKLLMNVAIKRPVKAGEMIMTSDIADIRQVKLANIKLSGSDKVAVCMKIGWKFGFFFDLARPEELDVGAMERDLGWIRRRLLFEHVYRTLQTGALMTQMLEDGWFPFVELLGFDFELLSQAYESGFDTEARIEAVLDRFSPTRVGAICERWWSNPLFSLHRPILEAGVQAYLKGGFDGHLACAKILGTEIEGILRRKAASDTGGLRGKVRQWIQHLAKHAKGRVEIDDSLLLPDMFREHLETRVFRQFQVDQKGRAKEGHLSRHSVSHGAASPESYTRARALQMILIVDQIYFHAA